MAFNYDQKDAANTLPTGQYAASILGVTQTKDDGSPMRSKSGEAMQMVTFEVYPNGEGKPRQMRAYFTAKSTLFRYRMLAKAIGQYEAFKLNKFDAADHIGTNLTLGLVVKDSPQYGEQNEIEEFLPMAAGSTQKREPAKPTQPATSGANDLDIPF